MTPEIGTLVCADVLVAKSSTVAIVLRSFVAYSSTAEASILLIMNPETYLDEPDWGVLLTAVDKGPSVGFSANGSVSSLPVMMSSVFEGALPVRLDSAYGTGQSQTVRYVIEYQNLPELVDLAVSWTACGIQPTSTAIPMPKILPQPIW